MNKHILTLALVACTPTTSGYHPDDCALTSGESLAYQAFEDGRQSGRDAATNCLEYTPDYADYGIPLYDACYTFGYEHGWDSAGEECP